jgi:hypothetical protein
VTDLDRQLVRDTYARAFGARIDPASSQFLSEGTSAQPLAVLGYTRAGAQPLFLERYLDCPVEDLVSAAFARPVPREQIVELGNLASCNGWALVRLWSKAANDLGAEMEFAVATLTAPLRTMFQRIGLPLEVLAPAVPGHADHVLWGSYYRADPLVCAGRIAAGQDAIARFFSNRRTGVAA